MKKLVKAFDISNSKISVSVNIDQPRQCPHCQIGIEPKSLSAFFIEHYGAINLFVLFFCPNCDNCFLVQYLMFQSSYENAMANPVRIFPHSEEKTDYAKNISDLSPDFVKIYHQAEKAENIGLDEICGLGYRKALEFLIKDYAIKFNPTKKENIKRQMLSPCINDYIDNRRIKTLATASAWIGNDETHYIRKHEDYNIAHLKAFITAIVSFIESELSYLDAASLLNKPK